MSAYPNLDPDARIRELENEVAELDQTLRQYEAWVKALGESVSEYEGLILEGEPLVYLPLVAADLRVSMADIPEGPQLFIGQPLFMDGEVARGPNRILHKD